MVGSGSRNTLHEERDPCNAPRQENWYEVSRDDKWAEVCERNHMTVCGIFGDAPMSWASSCAGEGRLAPHIWQKFESSTKTLPQAHVSSSSSSPFPCP
mmetsp:Transcript_59533/g.172426  ORF Transcript_59533/g.172426 Transcript_59533/m.172426 type:complete len:98 (+) Transcript_59533:266-559(+)